MKSLLASTLWACAAAGCSLIYNPNNLPEPASDGKQADAPIDAEIILDADPAALERERATPAVLFEGTGTGGSRTAVVVVEGKQIVPGAKISITMHGGGTAKVTVDDAKTEIAADGRMIAAPVTIDVDPNLDAGETIRLDVTVTQPNGMGGMIMKTLSAGANDAPIMTLQGLDELDDNDPAPRLLTGGLHEFSTVNLTSGGIGVAAAQTQPVVIHARGSITVVGGVDASATGKTAGPGAGDGGAHGAGTNILAGVDPGKPGTGTGKGTPSGGGAGFGGMGGAGGGGAGAIVGDAPLHDFATNRGSGGAGGNGKTATVGSGPDGGDGGGGGGAIELTAGGTLSADVVAKGGNATSGGSGGNPGGGGSGGTILLRSFGALTATADVSGGTGAGAGGAGRIRADAPTGTVAGAGFRGPMFAADTPIIVRSEKPDLSFVGEPAMSFTLLFENEDRTNSSNQLTQTTSSSGQKSFKLDEPLFRGINHVCLFTVGADLVARKDEAKNCVDIVYLYTP